MEKLKKYLVSYGRTNARKLKPSQQEAYDEVMGQYSFRHCKEATPPRQSSSPTDGLPRCARNDEYERIILEIGFGMGEHIAHRAKNDPQTLYIGCEPFSNGVARLCGEIQREKIENIRIHQGDARELIEGFADESVDKIFLMHPDPWPKAKHHKRRIVNQESLTMFARILKANGHMQTATDWVDYAKWILREFMTHPKFEWLAESKADWENEPEGHIQTKYQKKSLKEGRKALFMLFQKTN